MNKIMKIKDLEKREEAAAGEAEFRQAADSEHAVRNPEQMRKTQLPLCVRGKTFLISSHRRENGRTKTTYVPVELVEEVRGWSVEYHRLKELVDEITALGEEIVKRYVKEKK